MAPAIRADPAPAPSASASRPRSPWFCDPPASCLRFWAPGHVGPAGRPPVSPAGQAWHWVGPLAQHAFVSPAPQRAYHQAELQSKTTPPPPMEALLSLLSRQPRAEGTSLQGWEACQWEAGSCEPECFWSAQVPLRH